MHKLVKRHVAWIWIAALAVLFSALAPTISRAMAAATPGADEEVQVCTMEGMRTLVPAGHLPDKSDPHRFDHFLEQCPYCALHAGAAILPPSMQLAFAAPDVSFSHPPLFYQSAVPLFAWTRAHPRGPPGLI